MGVFKNKNQRPFQKRQGNTSKGMYFGKEEAEGENVQGSTTLDYFEDYLNVLDNLDEGKFLFVGRKGTGKSAIAMFIKDKSDADDDAFAKVIRIPEIKLESQIQGADLNKDASTIFEWIIVTTLVDLISKCGRGLYTSEFKKLQKFILVNRGIIPVDQMQTMSIDVTNGGEVNITPIKHILSGLIKRYFTQKQSKASFESVLPALRDVVTKLLSFEALERAEFWVMFDDLDIDYSADDPGDRLKIMSLIRTVKYYNTDVLSGSNATILGFLRDDMVDNVRQYYATPRRFSRPTRFDWSGMTKARII